MVGSLLTLIFLAAILYALVRYFWRGMAGGRGGFGVMAFIAVVLALPFRLLLALGRFYLHERRRRIKLPRQRSGGRLSSAAQRTAARAARTTPRDAGPYAAPDDDVE